MHLCQSLNVVKSFPNHTSDKADIDIREPLGYSRFHENQSHPAQSAAWRSGALLFSDKLSPPFWTYSDPDIESYSNGDTDSYTYAYPNSHADPGASGPYRKR